MKRTSKNPLVILGCHCEEAKPTKQSPSDCCLQGIASLPLVARNDKREVFRGALKKLTLKFAAAFAIALLPALASAAGSDEPIPSEPGDTQFDASGTSNDGFEPDYFSGAATYRIGIEVPPGRAGMTPKVGIIYNSHRYKADSSVGMGWELTETYIARSLIHGTPDYQGDDYVYHSNGQDIQIQYVWTDLTTGCRRFRSKAEGTDRKNFFKCGGGYWQMYDMDGRAHTFGARNETRLENANGDKVFRWYLERSEDPNGNAIAYSYKLTNESYRKDGVNVEMRAIVLSEIAYTGNEKVQNTTYPFRIRFEYGEMGRDHPDFRPEFAEYFPYLLDRIVIESNGNKVRDYALVHQFLHRLPFLSSVQATGYENNQPVPMPAKIFDHYTFNEARLWVRVWPAVSDPTGDGGAYDQDHTILDMNGDGLPDRVETDLVNLEGHKVYLNKGGSFSNAATIWRDTCSGKLCQSGSYKGHLRDMNGDGMPDRVLAGTIPYGGSFYRGFFVAFNSGSGWRWGQPWSDPFCGAGSPDIAQCGILELQDMNGDGLPDRVHHDGSSYLVYLNKGHGFSSAPETWNDPVGAFVQKRFADMNGDGLPDIIAEYGNGYGVFYNMGHGFAPSGDWWGDPLGGLPAPDSLIFQDVNDDGLPDLMAGYAATGNIRVHLNSGDGFADLFTIADPIGDPSYRGLLYYANGMPGLMDMDGDGYLDRLAPAGGAYTIAFTDMTAPGGELFEPPYHLKSIDNGRGVVSTLTYLSTNRIRNRLMPFPKFALAHMEKREGASLKETDISYAGGQFFTDWYNTVGRRFNGFNFVRIRDSLNNVEHRWYHQAHDVLDGDLFIVPNVTPPLAENRIVTTQSVASETAAADGVWKDTAISGRMYRMVKYIAEPGAAALTKHRETRYEWKSEWPNGETGWFIRLSKEEGDSFGEAGQVRTTRITYAHDWATGHLLQSDDHGWVGKEALRKTKFSDYAQYDTPMGKIESSRPGKIEALDSNNLLKNRTTDIYDGMLNLRERRALLIDQFGQRELTTLYGPDAYGNVIARTDPEKRVTTISYNASTNTYPHVTTVDGKYTTITEYDVACGKVSRSVGMDGREAKSAFDPFCRLKSTEFQGAWRERYEYAENLPSGDGRLLAVVSKFTNIVSDPESATKPREVVYRDGQGRILQRSLRSERKDGSYRSVHYSIIEDRGTNARSASDPYFTATPAFDLALGPWAETKTTLDSLGRPREVLPPTGDAGSPTGARQFSYIYGDNPWATTESDPRGKATRRHRDSRGNIVEAWEFLGAKSLRTVYGRDFWDNLASIRDVAWNITSFGYDNLRRRTSAHDKDAGLKSFEYDGVGNLKKQTDAEGNWTQFDYDALNRPKLVQSYLAGGKLDEEMRYIYDEAVDEKGADQRALYSVRKGELFEVVDKNGWQKFGYDLWGNIAKGVRKVAGTDPLFKTEYSYNSDGTLGKMTYPGDEVDISYTYDPSGKLMAMTEKKGEALYGIDPDTAYDAAGHLLRELRGNGVEDVFAYYPRSQRLFNVTTRSTATPTDIFRNTAYTYDEARNVTGIADALHGADQDTSLSIISYDDLGRLTGYTAANDWEANKSVSYSYDDIGNVLQNGESFGGAAYLYSPPHRITSIAGAAFGYDARGNVTSGRGRRYTYNARNIMTHVTMQNTWEMDYAYDYAGQRLQKTIKENGNPKSQSIYLGSLFELRDTAPFGGTNSELIHNIFAPSPHGAASQPKLIAVIGRGNLDTLKNAQMGAGSVRPRIGGWPRMGNWPPLPHPALLFALALILLFLAASFPLPLRERARVRGALRVLAYIFARYNPLSPCGRWPGRGGHSFAFRLASLAAIFLILHPTLAPAYVFKEDVDDDWPAITSEFFLYVHTDHLGSSNLYTEGLERTTHGGLRYRRGQVVQRVEYTPFGKERYVLNPALVEVPKYTGQTYDIDTDLYYYNARYYDPTLARFLQPDSIIPDAYRPQSLNPYAYVLNNPLRYIDPTGHGEDSYHGEEYDGEDSDGSESDAGGDDNSSTNDAFAGAKADGSVTGHNERDSLVDREQMREWAFEFGTMSGGIAKVGGYAASAIGKAGMPLLERIGRFFERLFGRGRSAAGEVEVGERVYRVWGGKSGPWGKSWTTVDPNSALDYRSSAGLPDVNTGRFVSEGRVQSTEGITSRGSLIFKEGQQGGLNELVIEEAERKILLDRVSGVNPEY